MPTLQELLEQKAALERQIIETQREERAGAIAQVKALMSQHGLTVADLGTKAPSGARRGENAGKLPPKYRDPATGNTWSGRGLQPNWLKSALANGKSLADFAV
jgi:DNA-binding protein H-NS